MGNLIVIIVVALVLFLAIKPAVIILALTIGYVVYKIKANKADDRKVVAKVQVQ